MCSDISLLILLVVVYVEILKDGVLFEYVRLLTGSPSFQELQTQIEDYVCFFMTVLCFAFGGFIQYCAPLCVSGLYE